MELVTTPTPAATAGALLAERLAARQSTPTLFLGSGGSAAAVFSHIQLPPAAAALTLTTLDERYSSDPAAHNFDRLAATPFWRAAVAASARELRVDIANTAAAHEAAALFAAALGAWRRQHPHGYVLALAGIGTDGHTAGIFKPADVRSCSAWACATTAPEAASPYQTRVTTTYTFFEEVVDEFVVYATGAEKRPLIEALAHGSCDASVIPACVYRSLPCVTLVTDQVVDG